MVVNLPLILITRYRGDVIIMVVLYRCIRRNLGFSLSLVRNITIVIHDHQRIIDLDLVIRIIIIRNIDVTAVYAVDDFCSSLTLLLG